MSRLLNFIEKKGTALTIPYSGYQRDLVGQIILSMVASSAKKHLLSSVQMQSLYFCLHILYTFFIKNLLVKLTKYSHIFPVKYVGSYHINIISTSNTSHLISCGHSPSINKSHHEKLDIPALDFS